MGRDDPASKNNPNRVVAIFMQALKVRPQERDAFLERRCGGDIDLRRRLEALLQAHDRLGNFLERSGDRTSLEEPD